MFFTYLIRRDVVLCTQHLFVYCVFICALKLLQKADICCILCLDEAGHIIRCPSADTETTDWCALNLWSHSWSQSDSDLQTGLVPIYSSIIWSRITAESALCHCRRFPGATCITAVGTGLSVEMKRSCAAHIYEQGLHSLNSLKCCCFLYNNNYTHEQNHCCVKCNSWHLYESG